MLILVRHGRTAANKARLLQGRLDQDLDDVGRAQALATAALVQGKGQVAEVISSPLARARQTANAFGQSVAVDERFVELSYGDLEGVPLSDVPDSMWERWRSDTGFAPPGGESLAALDLRVRAACEEVAIRAQTSNIVVVSHVSPMKSAVAWALGVDIGISWQCHLDHAAICCVGFSGGTPVLRTFNETAELAAGVLE